MRNHHQHSARVLLSLIACLAFAAQLSVVHADPSADFVAPSATLTAPTLSVGATSIRDSDSGRDTHHHHRHSRHHRDRDLGKTTDQAGQSSASGLPNSDTLDSQSAPEIALQQSHAAAIVKKIHPAAAVSTAAPVSLDSMTRDGAAQPAQPKPAQDTPDTASMDVGASIFRMIVSLLLVLAIIGSAIYTLKKRGYGTGVASETGAANPKPKFQFGVNPWAATIAQQMAQTRQRPQATPASASFPVGPLSDLDIVGVRQLPGSSVTLYKIRSGDRLLLIGASQSGSVTVLSEWDVETKPENERRFEEMLDRASVLSGAALPESDALRDLSSRLGQTAQRLSMIGNKASGRDEDSQ